jgi:hypothetical protein
MPTPNVDCRRWLLVLSRALEAIFRDIIDTHDGATYFAEGVWGIDLRYELGADHPPIGGSAPEFELPGGTKLGEHLQKGQRGGC